MTPDEIAASEPHRHACEVRYVANLPSNIARQSFLAGVAKKRSEEEAKRLREDAWVLMQANRRAA